MDQKIEIRSYIKCCIRLNIDSKQIFNEMYGIYGSQTISMRTVFRWVKAFKAGKFSVEDDTYPGRLKTSVTKANIAAVKIVVEKDVQLSVKDIASCTGMCIRSQCANNSEKAFGPRKGLSWVGTSFAH